MTLFRILMNAAGLSLAQASAFLGARQDSVVSWSSGRRATPAGVIAEMHALTSRQQRAASEGSAVIEQQVAQHGMPEAIELGLAADDHEAQSLGWPTMSAHAAVLGLTLSLLSPGPAARVVLVPRGSTAASAAAADLH
jgi:hypothetical protein